MTEADWVDSGSGPGWEVPVGRLHEPPTQLFPRLSKLRGIRPAIPGPTEAVPVHVEVDALWAILERHVTGADGICCCGERAGEFTGRCRIGRAATKRLMALRFQGHEIP